MENDASHSAQHSSLIYLLQEVSKLASPTRNSFLDSDPTSTRLNETPRPAPFIFRHGVSHVAPHGQGKNVKEESQDGNVATSIEPRPECKSPWKVLSLINLQCEQLLHHGDVEESDPTWPSSAPALGHSIDISSTAPANLKDRGGDYMHVKYSYKPSVLTYVREEIPACESPARDVRAWSGGASRYKTDCCAKHSTWSCCAQSQTAERLEVSATASSQPHYRELMEDRCSVDRQLESNREYREDRSSSELDILSVPFSEKAFSQTTPNASQLSFDSDVDTNVAPSKPALILDHNANLALTTDAQLCHRSAVLSSSLAASLLFSITERAYRLPNQEDKITTSQHKCTHLEDKSPRIAHLKSSSSNDETNPSPSATSQPEPRRGQKEEIAPPSSQQWTSKAQRKQPHPSRSVDIQEADLQGVMFRMDTELDDSREECRLLITSKYSKELCKGARKPRMRTRTSQKSLKVSSSDEESDLTTGVSKGKICASCCTRKTPMWRDAEDGTPLCNACGIRYKKYRVRCINCWNIPRKEGNSNSCCLKCGNFVKLTSAVRKHTA